MAAERRKKSLLLFSFLNFLAFCQLLFETFRDSLGGKKVVEYHLRFSSHMQHCFLNNRGYRLFKKKVSLSCKKDLTHQPLVPHFVKYLDFFKKYS